ncbi:MAG: glycosyltransferase family 4 protein [bacterium]|nr:glycosyltransferase family 4 protein [bacterium]
MKIAYVIHGYASVPVGVMRKVEGQIDCWRKAGREVALFVLVKDEETVREKFSVNQEIGLTTEIYQRRLERVSAITRLWKQIDTWRPDLIYHRYDLYHRSITRFAEQVPLILEINTDDTREYKSGAKLIHWLNLASRKRLLTSASGLCFVSSELSRSSRFSKFKRPSAVIGNGVDISLFETLPPSQATSPRLLFIGSNRYHWHGVDRLVTLARQCPDYGFDIVGATEADLFVDLPPNVLLHGYMEPSQYRKVMEQADVAIGSLALDRIGIREASPLKHREYLASGLPIIAACKDTDFPEPVEFILELPGDFDPASLVTREAVEQFVRKWQGKRVCRAQVKQIDMTVKESARLEFFEQIHNGKMS